MHSSRMRTARTLTVFPGQGGVVVVGVGEFVVGGGGAGVVTRPPDPPPPRPGHPPLQWTEWVTHACENITFARFAMLRGR